jgi:hypothetical protein
MRHALCIGMGLLLLVSAEALARSRAQFEELLRRLDTADVTNVAKLKADIDAQGAQVGAWQSRFYWHTEWSDALAEAKASGKPILSLRLLGRLDEELSCANSRFFRKSLYVRPEIARAMRDRYVLHWQSLRPVPILTIDYGDGRTVKRTITGNSIHYAFTPDGTLLDAMPGLCDEQTFLSELDSIAAFAGGGSKSEADRQAYWRETSTRLTRPAEPAKPVQERLADRSARRAMTKRVAELPTLAATRNPASAVAQDTQLNQRQLRPTILGWIAAGAGSDVAKLNDRVYRELFLAPLDDPDMGLNPPDEAALAN